MARMIRFGRFVFNRSLRTRIKRQIPAFHFLLDSLPQFFQFLI